MWSHRMGIFILLIVAFIAFAVYRYKKYQKQRQLEEMAAEAQASVSAEVVEILQRYKTLKLQCDIAEFEQRAIEEQIKNLTENLLCHTDSENSVREYRVISKQNIALLNRKLDRYSTQLQDLTDVEFDALK